ncbi:hypothetical protein FC756_22050 [Lysinibacillus mangiferihumi]|uniref:Uncharacterized protein n=1 Tax=Lysinibacillus mangiferihumi TaxID=1130819 RepID=A0A4U2Y0E7_9BACI|nr:hypothetical protein [Lysinibacillus mangiferihumi]TKI53800.1 hypothetical protein FC756_22050 [Lysinibacillus mangiferihumi]
MPNGSIRISRKLTGNDSKSKLRKVERGEEKEVKEKKWGKFFTKAPKLFNKLSKSTNPGGVLINLVSVVSHPIETTKSIDNAIKDFYEKENSMAMPIQETTNKTNPK